MKSRTVAMSVVALAGIATGALLVRSVTFGETRSAGYSSSTASPAAQASGEYVFACVNKSGKIDYLEFRLPLPHQCWYSGESLWHFAALPAVAPSPSPSASASTSASPSPSPSPSTSSSSPAAAASTSPSASGSDTATSTPAS